MHNVFSTSPEAGTATGGWSVAFDRTQVLLTLQQAAERANLIGDRILASFTQPITPYNPLHIFTAFQQMDQGECFFWARPAEQRVLVGMGAATSIETDGPGCIGAAAATWRQLRQHAVVAKASGTTPALTDGPVLFGGFRFDPLSPHTALWAGFPDGLLILPRLLFHCDETSTALTANILVQPGADCITLADELYVSAQRLEALVRQAPESTHEPTHKRLRTHNLLSPEAWMRLIADTVKHIRTGRFEKVVLARAVRLTSEGRPFDLTDTVAHLCASYPQAHIFAIKRGTRTFVGATPERLICSADGQIQTMALAGSAPRGSTEEEDQRIGHALMESIKNQGEHRVVVETLRTALSAICSRVWIADAPHLLKFKNIQHLETPITGDLLPGRSILEAIEDLHPTPAVGGFPRQAALAHIRAQEQLDRGWYAGPIGWIGSSGNGEFAVALRSALIEANTATLFAGCGIVADSEPESELAESGWKLEVMQRGLAGEN